MAKNKFYVVKKGRTPGIYTTWDECKNEVAGYKGAIYKSFSGYQDAKDFFSDEHGYEKSFNSDDKVIAFVDGSYNITTGEFSYGAVAFYKGEKICFSKKFNDVELSSMRNVAGEIEGAKFIMQYCVENNIRKLDIYYDYMGIEKWARGLWKTNKVGTMMYKKYYDSIKDKVKVNFIKVKAHSNNKYNDLADKLAKEAIGIA
ncbi:MAG: ribonuclease H family protein [Clostridiales bacterium]|nr:ribonuclease H family protein [Clostridiales bacterium]